MKEIWKPVVGYGNLYSISNKGRVRRDKQSSGTQKGIILKLSTDKRGYFTIGLFKNKKVKTWRIHVLVASAFIGKRPENLQINHMDCNKKNNFLYNLEYVTALENVRHSIANGLINRPTINITGENNPSSKLTNKKVIKIRKLFKIGNITQIELGKLFNVHNTTISGIIRRVYWKHV